MELRALVLPYPNFVLGAIIDPEEANENNYEISERVNDLFDYLLDFSTDNVKMTSNIEEISGTDLQEFLVAFKNFVDDKVSNLQSQITTNKTSISSLQQKDINLQTQITNNLSTLQNLITSNVNNLQSLIASNHNSLQTLIGQNKADIETKLNTHKNSTDHDRRYYTKDELGTFLRSGDTSIKREVFTIVSADNLNNTFTYVDTNGVQCTGMLLENGEQVFTLTKGFYELDLERIEVTVNDTLQRTVTSGGLMEISSTEFALTSPEQNGAEITVKYYEKIGLAGINIIHYGTVVPDGYAMWYKVV